MSRVRTSSSARGLELAERVSGVVAGSQPNVVGWRTATGDNASRRAAGRGRWLRCERSEPRNQGPTSLPPVEFTGFPVAALDFYDDLEVDNTKSFWDAHKAIYDDQVKAPMVAMTDALAQEFGDAKVFRPYRDVRFAKD